MGQFWRLFDRTLHGVVGIIVLALAIIGVMQVFFRYVIESSLAWTDELSRILLMWLVLLAAGAEVKRGTHIAMKLLLERFPPAVAAWIERLNLVLIFGFAAIMVVYGLELSERTMAQTASTLPVRMGQVYLALPLAGLIMAVNAVRVLVEGFRLPAVPARVPDTV